jgi:diacylglycerol kinase family enzyme
MAVTATGRGGSLKRMSALATAPPRPAAARTPSWEASSPPRLLLVVNPKATAVSNRLKTLVMYALRGRYDLDFVETEAPNHATELAREAVRQRYDLVVSFGGDGTLNETANGLAGSEVPLAMLPGGSTNVMCRMLGLPTDVIDATEHLLGMADGPRLQRVDLGSVNGRYFLFSSGVGLDAETVRWVDSRGSVKARRAYLWFAYSAITRYMLSYRARPPLLATDIDGRRVEGISAFVQNSDPFTYFRNRPLHVGEEIGLDTGCLSVVVLKRGLMRDAFGATWRLFTPANVARHPQGASFTRVSQALIEPADGEPLPVQVDGDYIGDHPALLYEAHPGALTLAT